ncbi:class A beta-lactamase [Streptomyces sp. NBC_00842]|uniref:class A beta-lactamase n=1 Tax=Streptomyces sp. NBC_00842 TaxID=2975848 RepID=UPI00386AAF5A|nr:class A beta-lactamase [Streptomyces sp. NBC_00842]WTA48313.1 class A beta-lactamase [Streptomyces sp. NBC_00842]
MTVRSIGARATRRTVLAAGAALAAGAGAAPAAVSPPPPAHAASAAPGAAARVTGQLRALEREHSARLGAYAHDTATGRTVVYRADERFAMCSLFKTIGAAAVLRDLDRGGEFLARRIRYTAQYVEACGHSPITGRSENLSRGMTVADLCRYSITHSDNTAANLLLRELGGPTAITRLCRSIGDPVTRLDRWEPELNSAEPWRETDTTTPRAIGRTYARLVLGDALAPRDSRLLTGWLLANTTSGERFRTGLLAGWTVADKTAGGSYGGNNDAGVAWPPGRPPVVLAVMTTKPGRDAPADNPLVAKTAGVLAAALS